MNNTLNLTYLVMAFMWHTEKQKNKVRKHNWDTVQNLNRRNVVLNQFMIEAFIEGTGYLGTYLH